MELEGFQNAVDSGVTGGACIATGQMRGGVVHTLGTYEHTGVSTHAYIPHPKAQMPSWNRGWKDCDRRVVVTKSCMTSVNILSWNWKGSRVSTPEELFAVSSFCREIDSVFFKVGALIVNPTSSSIWATQTGKEDTKLGEWRLM